MTQNTQTSLARLSSLRQRAQAPVSQGDFETLLKVSVLLHSTLDVSELFRLIVTEAVQLTRANQGALFTIKPDGTYHIEAASNDHGVALTPADFQFSRTVVKQVIESRVPLFQADVLDDDALSIKTSVLTLGIRAVLCAPLVKDGQIVGLIYTTATDPGEALSAHRLKILDILAGHAVVALHQAGLYNEIRRLYEKTKILDAAKSDFIAVASHELRTPLALVRGYSEMLLSMPMDATQQEIVKGIHGGAVRLSEIVGDMLESAQIDQGGLPIKLAPYSLKALLKEVGGHWQDAAAERRLALRLVYDTDPEDGVPCRVDTVYLTQALGHLIRNAIKFTPDGGAITVRLARSDEWVTIAVEDTGIGVKPEQRAYIFEKFYRGEDSRFHSTGKTKFMGAGPGLGLYIVKGVVQGHGGQVEIADNGAGPGSRFMIKLPASLLSENADDEEYVTSQKTGANS